MKELGKKIILYSIVFLLMLTFVLAMIKNIKNGIWLSIFWTCYIFMILVSIGIIFKKPKLILSQIVIMLIPSILWTIDFVVALMTRTPPIGLISNIFTNGKIDLSGILNIYHALIVPLAILAIIIMKPKGTKGYLKISFIEIILLFILSTTIPQLYGINCFPGPEICTNMALQYFPLYPLIYLVILATAVLISSLAIDYILKKLKN